MALEERNARARESIIEFIKNQSQFAQREREQKLIEHNHAIGRVTLARFVLLGLLSSYSSSSSSSLTSVYSFCVVQ